jgi:hypothetical protein
LRPANEGAGACCWDGGSATAPPHWPSWLTACAARVRPNGSRWPGESVASALTIEPISSRIGPIGCGSGCWSASKTCPRAISNSLTGASRDWCTGFRCCGRRCTTTRAVRATRLRSGRGVQREIADTLHDWVLGELPEFLTFYAAGDQAFHDVFLGQEEHDDKRQDVNHRRGHADC